MVDCYDWFGDEMYVIGVDDLFAGVYVVDCYDSFG